MQAMMDSSRGDSLPGVLIAVPDLSKGGGVAGYFRVSASRFTWPVEFVTRGSRGPGGTFRRIWRLSADYYEFARLLSTRRHLLVHQNTSFGADGLRRDALSLIMSKLAGRRVVVFVHGWDQRLEKRMSDARLALFRMTYFRADAIIVLAEQFRDRLLEWGYKGRIYVETTIVDDACAVAADALEPRDPALPFELLFMARVEENKGVLVAIDAVRELVREGYDVRLTVAGAGSAVGPARACAADMGDAVVFPGYVSGSEKFELLKRSHAYILPTTHGEGMPTTILEAMAAGLPVITRPVGGVRDFFVHGEMGLLSSRTDAPTFAELVRRLVLDEHCRVGMARCSAAFARDRFLASRVVARLESIYGEVLGCPDM